MINIFERKCEKFLRLRRDCKKTFARGCVGGENCFTRDVWIKNVFAKGLKNIFGRACSAVGLFN